MPQQSTSVAKNISDDGDDDFTKLRWSIQAANDRAIYALKQAGYNADHLKATLQQGWAAEEKKICQSHSPTHWHDSRCLQMHVVMVVAFM